MSISVFVDTPTNKTKILLVDDNEIIRIFFRDVFWLHGLDDNFDLKLASGVEEAQKIIQDPSTRPDIIFLDLVMPMKKGETTVTSSEAGFFLLKEIKENPAYKNIKVIIFSSYSDKGSMDQAKKAGADMFLTKEEHLPQDLVRVVEGLTKKT